MKQVTDLRPWYTEFFESCDVITGAWIITDGEKKQIVVKFNGVISKTERMIYLHMIANKLMKTADKEDEKAGGKSSFGDLMDGMQLREWQADDDEIIRNGVPHEIKTGGSRTMKRILVLSENDAMARREAFELRKMIADSTLIKARLYTDRNEVQTENVVVRFVTRRCCFDGMTCDVPVGFENYGTLAEKLARGKEYPKLNNLKEIAKYIVEEELK